MEAFGNSRASELKKEEEMKILSAFFIFILKILSAFFLFLFEVFCYIYMAIAVVLFAIIAGVVMAPFILFELLLGDK